MVKYANLQICISELCTRHTMKMKTKNTLIPDRSKPGITMTAPTVRHRDVGDKYATGVPKTKKIGGDNAVLDCSQPPEEDLQPILREEVEIAVTSLKKGKSVGVDNIPAELVQAGGETMIDV